MALIADTHFGARNDDRRLLDHQVSFYREVFFPGIYAAGCEAIVHLGDLVDRRKYISYRTASTMRREYLEKAARYQHHVIVGNHDIALRDSVEINALREIMGDGFGKIHEHPTNVLLGGLPCLMLPWICAANAVECVEQVQASRAEFCFAHLELAGFEHYRGQVAQKGMGRKLFDGFGQVVTGHYHEPSEQGNVRYLGAPYEMSWADAECERGFGVLDTVTREIEFHRNPLTLHAKLRYGDDLELPDPGAYRDKIVRVVVESRENEARFDMVMAALDEVGADVTVIDDRLAVTSLDDAAQIKAGDTLQTMEAYVEETYVGEDGDKRELVGLLGELYREATERMQ